MSEPTQISEAAVEAAVAAALAAIEAAADSAALKAARSEHTAEGSPLARLNASIRNVPNDQKAAAGKLVGRARRRVNQAFAAKEAVIQAAEEAAQLAAEAVDVTAAPDALDARGAASAVACCRSRSATCSSGWAGRSPRVRSSRASGTTSTPSTSTRTTRRARCRTPSSSSRSTRHLVLRTHTRPVQLRALLGDELPVYVVAPGRVFRTDEFDATHTPVFHQIEGIAVDKGLTMAHLRGTLEHFVKHAVRRRARRSGCAPTTSRSPSRAPSSTLWHPTFKGGARWIEWGGCGMVNPNVLRAAGIDPEVYSGFAFGMGIERALMFRNDVKDMRDMVEGDVRFSQQFGMVV